MSLGRAQAISGGALPERPTPEPRAAARERSEMGLVHSVSEVPGVDPHALGAGSAEGRGGRRASLRRVRPERGRPDAQCPGGPQWGSSAEDDQAAMPSLTSRDRRSRSEGWIGTGRELIGRRAVHPARPIQERPAWAERSVVSSDDLVSAASPGHPSRLPVRSARRRRRWRTPGRRRGATAR
jgi:hypothetical protein